MELSLQSHSSFKTLTFAKKINMDAKIYHLSTCKTCQKVIAALNNGEGFEMQDIKFNNITAPQLDALKEKVGSYEALFSRRAMKYRSMGLADQQLSEDDYRRLILDEYTFLKRPVVLVGDEVFVGSSKKAVQGALEALKG
jgi:arsenate reductase